VSGPQAVLRAVAASRFRAACPDLATGFDLETQEGLLAAKEAAGHAPTRVVAVLGRCDLARWVGATSGFVLGLTAAGAAGWRRSLTTTVFLAGNPANLRGRFAFDHLDGDLGWIGPAPARTTTVLCRLLRAYDAPDGLPAGRAHRMRVPGDPTRPPLDQTLQVATAGVSLSRTLVHLHHLIAEAILDGHLGAGDRLTVRTVPRIDVTGTFLALRVDVDHSDPHRLRAYAGLVGP
jgi:hypothetical protein